MNEDRCETDGLEVADGDRISMRGEDRFEPLGECMGIFKLFGDGDGLESMIWQMMGVRGHSHVQNASRAECPVVDKQGRGGRACARYRTGLRHFSADC